LRTDFSEFSFGYALVEEFARSLRPGLKAAPIFPSLIEEGGDEGGYDVKFDLPGVPMMIQFKRPDVMKTAKAKEIANHGLALNPPFYRFHMRSSAISRQHDLLLAHDAGSALVYYASPCFHEINDFDTHYIARNVINNTIFIRPRDIGPLSAELHHVSYDAVGLGWCFSDSPRSVDRIAKGRAVEDHLAQALSSESRPLREGVLEQAISSVTESFRRDGLRTARTNPRLEALSGPRGELARLSELSQVYLNAQLFIVQRRDA
jgi:hypothetical protein